jgi:hypothetical protein
VPDNCRQPRLEPTFFNEMVACAGVGSFKIVDQLAKSLGGYFYPLCAVSVLAQSVREEDRCHFYLPFRLFEINYDLTAPELVELISRR